MLGSISILGYDSTYDHDGDFVLTARVGANAGNLYRYSGKVKITDNTVYLQSNYPVFLEALLSYFNIKRLSFGTGQPLIKASELKKLSIMVPENASEITNIQKFLEVLSDTIALHERKLELIKKLKQAYLQQMFTKKEMQKPLLRFVGFTQEWEQRKLGDIGLTTSGVGFPEVEQGGKDGTPFYKVSDMTIAGNKVIMARANNYVTDLQIQQKHWKPITKVPAIIFAKVGAALLLNRKRLANSSFLIDNNMMAYSFGVDWDVAFGLALFQTIKLQKYAQTGALPSFNGSDISDIKICLPNKEEQVHIGLVFTSLDKDIDLHERKLLEFIRLKRGYLQKLFI